MENNELICALVVLFLYLLRARNRLCIIPALFMLPVTIHALAVLGSPDSVEAWFDVCAAFVVYGLLAQQYKNTRWGG